MASSRFPAATDQWEKTSIPVRYPVLVGVFQAEVSAEVQRRSPEALARQHRKIDGHEKHLTIGRVRRFARRTRDYCRAYREIQLGVLDGQGLQLVEKMRDTQKPHRNILNMEPGFLGKQ
ncbi:unnamed protein product [Pylaiella littoralis]